IHVVDLDGARTGVPANLAVIERIGSAVRCPLQVGGGVRSASAAGTLLAAGAARVVVGTVAVEQPALVDELCARHPQQIAVGLDARGRDVAVRGWTEDTGADLRELAARFGAAGVAALIVTAIERDGTMEGPALDQLGSRDARGPPFPCRGHGERPPVVGRDCRPGHLRGPLQRRRGSGRPGAVTARRRGSVGRVRSWAGREMVSSRPRAARPRRRA
ncbi:MAG: hypothetical protein E6G60_06915, partial [Actinobacteria bacterium]